MIDLLTSIALTLDFSHLVLIICLTIFVLNTAHHVFEDERKKVKTIKKENDELLKIINDLRDDQS